MGETAGSVIGDDDLGTVRIDPTEAVAGEYVTVTIACTAGRSGMEPGGGFAVWEYAGGNVNDFLLPHFQTLLPRETWYTTLRAPDGVEAQIALDPEQRARIVRITVGGRGLSPGEEIVATFGDTGGGGPGLRLKPVTHTVLISSSVRCSDRSPWVDLPGELSFQVQPGELSGLRVIAPSDPIMGEPFGMLVRPVDSFGNTTACTTAWEADPVTGMEAEEAAADTERAVAPIRLGARFTDRPERTPVRIKVRGREGDLVSRSNPIRPVESHDELKVFWGDLHCHSHIGHGLESPEFVLAYARDEEGLDFVAPVEHDCASGWLTSVQLKRWSASCAEDYIAQTWELRKGLARQYDDPGRFAAFPAYEWASNLYGHMNVIYAEDDPPLFYPASFGEDVEATPSRLWEQLGDRECMTIPHHTSRVGGHGISTSGFDWRFHHEGFMRVVEIVSNQGASEYLGCDRPVTSQMSRGTVLEALKRGYRLGFIGSTDSHFSRAGGMVRGDHIYRGAAVAVLASSLDRRSVLDALRQRRCYATTGARILMSFSVNDTPMGGELTLASPEAPKEIEARIDPTEAVEETVVVKNGNVLSRHLGTRPLALFDDERTEGTDFYYLRVKQRDGNLAWSSPIWISASGAESQTH